MLNSSLNCRINLTAIPVLNWDGGEKIARVKAIAWLLHFLSLLLFSFVTFGLQFIFQLLIVFKTTLKSIKSFNAAVIPYLQTNLVCHQAFNISFQQVFHQSETGKFSNNFPLQSILIL